MKLRHDRGTLQPPRELPDGTLLVDAQLTCAGVFEYPNPDGTIRREYRSPEEVFSAQAMKTFEAMAVTDYHPPVVAPDYGLVTVENRTELNRGYVKRLRRDGNWLIGELHITDKSLIQAMRNGRTAVSCGYEQDYIKGSGSTPDGRQFDGRQTNIIGNHVAIVDVARAGDDARVRMDAATLITGETSRMKFKTQEEAEAAYEAEKLRADTATRLLDTERLRADGEKKRADDAVIARDIAVDKAEKAEKTRLDGEANAMKKARERIALETSAGRFLREEGEDEKTFTGRVLRLDSGADRPDIDIMIEVTERLIGKELPAERRKDPTYVRARYDAAIEDAGESDAAIADVRVSVERGSHVRQDSAADLADKEYKSMCERNQKRWETSRKGS